MSNENAWALTRPPAACPLKGSLSHTQTHRWTEPILYPRPLTREGITLFQCFMGVSNYFRSRSSSAFWRPVVNDLSKLRPFRFYFWPSSDVMIMTSEKWATAKLSHAPIVEVFSSHLVTWCNWSLWSDVTFRVTTSEPWWRNYLSLTATVQATVAGW